MRLAVYPGDGVVARLERVVLLVPGSGEASTAAASRLVEACRSTDKIRERLRELGQGALAAPFLALVEQAGSIELYIHGAMRIVVVLQASRMEFASGDASDWLEETVSGEPVSIAAGLEAARTGSPRLFDLERGVVPGAGFEMVGRAGARPAPTGQSGPSSAGTVLMTRSAISAEAGAAIAGKGFEQLNTLGFDAAGPVPDAISEAAPLVEGRVCSNGHVNDPASETCAVCGAALGPVTSRVQRPPLGRLTANNGQTMVVERSLIIGRKPVEAPEVAAGQHGTFVVPATESGVSRVHAEIRIDHWNVLLVDRNSANGTFVKPSGLDEWIRLDPGHAVQITHGTSLAVGPYELRFEAI